MTPALAAAGPGSATGEAQQVIPTVFRWEHGGNQVYITGTFNNWSRKVPMHRSGNDFVYIQSLPTGKHAYKFVVDDEWRFAPDQPTVADTAGNINNMIDLANFIPEEEAAPPARKDSLPHIPYGHALPDEDEYSKEPPLLPPHLRQIILNAPSPDVSDSLRLPMPQSVTLNHLYETAIKDGLMVQAITQRYRRKFVSTVFYTMMPLASASMQAAAAPQAAATPTVPLNLPQPPPGATAATSAGPRAGMGMAMIPPAVPPPAAMTALAGPTAAQQQQMMMQQQRQQAQPQQPQPQQYGGPPPTAYSGSHYTAAAPPPLHPTHTQMGYGGSAGYGPSPSHYQQQQGGGGPYQPPPSVHAPPAVSGGGGGGGHPPGAFASTHRHGSGPHISPIHATGGDGSGGGAHGQGISPTAVMSGGGGSTAYAYAAAVAAAYSQAGGPNPYG